MFNSRQAPGDCDTIVAVDFSTLNYKDAMVVNNKYVGQTDQKLNLKTHFSQKVFTCDSRYPGLKPPMVGGIDLVGRILETSSSTHK